MNSRRLGVAAVACAVLAVVLWWFARDIVTGAPPVIDPPVEGSIERIHTDPRLLLAATVLAGLTMVLTTLAVLGRAPRVGS